MVFSAGLSLVKKCWEYAELRGLRRDVAVFLFFNLDVKEARGCSATLGNCADDATDSQQRQMDNYSLTHNNARDLIATLGAVMVKEIKYHTYQYMFHKANEVSSILADAYSAAVFACHI